MILGYLTLITALAISAVAIYYSVAGLVAIFAAAAIPIVIMGSTLEVAKLVTAVWLHKYWDRAAWWLKTYLAMSVIVLMFITSMGIFGFLSKAHIEQTSASQESVAQVQRLETEIVRQDEIQKRAEDRIRQLETGNTGTNATVQGQIDREQERIDRAYERIQPAIQEQTAVIQSQGKIFRDELARLDEKLALLQGYIDQGGRENIQRAQQMVGARADGAFGPNTAQAFRDWQTARQQERAEFLTKIEQATNNPQARAARNEILRLRRAAELEITESNKLISRLRAQLGQNIDKVAVEAEITDQQTKLKTAVDEIDVLSKQKYELQAEYRKLEAEVGPIKYIAEFIYGNDADKNMLEEAVRWVIIIIIFVFDPLAVLLLIASQYTFNWRKQEKIDTRESKKKTDDLDAASPLRTDDNEKNTTNEMIWERSEVWPSYDPDFLDMEKIRKQSGVDQNMQMHEKLFGDAESAKQDKVQSNELTLNEVARGYVEVEHFSDKEIIKALAQMYDENLITPVDEEQFKRIEKLIEDVEVPIEKKDIKSPEELKREADYELKEQDEIFQTKKAVWKEAHPDQTLKHYKNLYVKGIIDSLPWERSNKDDNYSSEGYQQNAEQNENTLFNKLSKK